MATSFIASGPIQQTIIKYPLQESNKINLFLQVFEVWQAKFYVLTDSESGEGSSPGS